MSDFSALREKAGLSQAQLAERITLLGEQISQEQISRYEKNPERIPLGLLKCWTKALGFSSIGAAFDADDTNGIKPIDPGRPYILLDQNLHLLREYITIKEPPLDGQPQGVPAVVTLLSLLDRLDRKPNLVLAGKFDGKR